MALYDRNYTNADVASMAAAQESALVNFVKTTYKFFWCELAHRHHRCARRVYEFPNGYGKSYAYLCRRVCRARWAYVFTL